MKIIRNLYDSIIRGFEMAGYARAYTELRRMGKTEEADHLLEIMKNRTNA